VRAWLVPGLVIAAASCGRIGFDLGADPARDGPVGDGALSAAPLVHAASTVLDAQCATLVFTADAMTVDGEGRVYLGGCVSGAGTFGSFPYATTAPETGYIAALDPALTVTNLRVFAATAGTAGVFELGAGGGWIHATGLFDTAIDVGSGPLATLGADDMLVARYEPGTLGHQSSDTFGSVDDDDNGYGLAVEPGGRAIVGGGCNGASFAFGALAVVGTDHDPCIALIDDGVALDGYRWPGAGTGGTFALALTPGDDIAIAGFYVATPPFPGLGVGAMADGFIARVTLAGTLQWAADLVGAGDDAAVEVAAGDAGDVYAMGHFNDVATLDGEPLPFAGGYDGWIARFDSDGSLAWVTTAGTPGDDDIRNAAVDGDLVLVAGNFEGTLALGDDVLVSAGSSDFFVAALGRADGAVRWARRFGGAGDDRVRAMSTYGARVYLTGVATPPLDLGGGVLPGTRTGAFVLALEPQPPP
jgi:hypothetical protein